MSERLWAAPAVEFTTEKFMNMQLVMKDYGVTLPKDFREGLELYMLLIDDISNYTSDSTSYIIHSRSGLIILYPSY